MMALDSKKIRLLTNKLDAYRIYLEMGPFAVILISLGEPVSAVILVDSLL